MTQNSRPWNGITTGDASEAPYDAPTEFARILMSIAQAFGVATDFSGVFSSELNELAATGVATPVSVASGRGLVYGTWYENDAAVSVDVVSPGTFTRYDRIVLRKDWVTQTVRIQHIVGVENAGVPPTLGAGTPAYTQTVGDKWDYTIATFSITVGGAITLTDTRDWLPRVHTHATDQQGGQLDWDTTFSDAVHNHSSNAEGGPNLNLTSGDLILPSAAAPAPTVEGDIEWDTNDNVIRVGDGVGTKTFPNSGHVHSGGDQGSKLDWDDIWNDSVHDHSSANEGGITVSPTTSTTLMVKLAEVLVGAGGQATISFTAIPGTYKHLLLLGQFQSDNAGNDDILLTFNSDGGVNYSYSNGGTDYPLGGPSNPFTGGATGQTSILLYSATPGIAAALPGSLRLEIPNYIGTTFNKLLTYQATAALGATGAIRTIFGSGVWLSTAAITRIDLVVRVGTEFNQGSYAALYGIP